MSVGFLFLRHIPCLSHVLHNIAKNAFNKAMTLEASLGLIEEQARDLYNLFTACGWQIRLKTKIQNYVETRWTSRQNLFRSIRKNFQQIIEILEEEDLLEDFNEIRSLPHGKNLEFKNKCKLFVHLIFVLCCHVVRFSWFCHCFCRRF